jgi:hypothetical protein
MAGNSESAKVLRKKPFFSFDEVTLAAKVTRFNGARCNLFGWEVLTICVDFASQ